MPIMLEQAEKIKIKFEKPVNSGFSSVVRERVLSYFKDNRIPMHGNKDLYLKAVGFLFVYCALYIGIISNEFQGWKLIALYTCLGSIKALIGFNIVHDALHNSFCSNPKINRFLGYWFDLNGTSSHIWKISHNSEHHVYTNVPGVDQDIEKAIWLRFSPKDKLYWFHYFQNWYAPFLYCITTLYWVHISDFTWFYKEFKKRTLSRSEVSLFLFFKSVNFLAFILVPLIYLDAPWWQVLLGCLGMQFAGGITTSFVFQMAHLVEGLEYPEPDATGKIPRDWAMHEMATTSNFATHNAWLSFLLGGLNFQVEHHLFPQICHVHYPAIAKIVKATAKEYGVPYHEKKTLTRALKSHFLHLKYLGRNPNYPLK
jgi:linoleoyl-CoA desaturase